MTAPAQYRQRIYLRRNVGALGLLGASLRPFSSGEGLTQFVGVGATQRSFGCLATLRTDVGAHVPDRGPVRTGANCPLAELFGRLERAACELEACQAQVRQRLRGCTSARLDQVKFGACGVMGIVAKLCRLKPIQASGTGQLLDPGRPARSTLLQFGAMNVVHAPRGAEQS